MSRSLTSTANALKRLARTAPTATTSTSLSSGSSGSSNSNSSSGSSSSNTYRPPVSPKLPVRRRPDYQAAGFGLGGDYSTHSLSTSNDAQRTALGGQDGGGGGGGQAKEGVKMFPSVTSSGNSAEMMDSKQRDAVDGLGAEACYVVSGFSLAPFSWSSRLTNGTHSCCY